jgi:hypothetical protein
MFFVFTLLYIYYKTLSLSAFSGAKLLKNAELCKKNTEICGFLAKILGW